LREYVLEVTPTRVGIVGAGPAGLVAAIAARKLGLEAHVFESASQFRRIGGGIAIQDNGLRVLEALGILESLRADMHEVRVVRIKAQGERPLITFDFSALPLRYP
jgi:2-polyprenyl-6-methoxyphenol hydroxylase-like FAD-dependent oxidoreductase